MTQWADWRPGHAQGQGQGGSQPMVQAVQPGTSPLDILRQQGKIMCLNPAIKKNQNDFPHIQDVKDVKNKKHVTMKPVRVWNKFSALKEDEEDMNDDRDDDDDLNDIEADSPTPQLPVTITGATEKAKGATHVHGRGSRQSTTNAFSGCPKREGSQEVCTVGHLSCNLAMQPVESPPRSLVGPEEPAKAKLPRRDKTNGKGVGPSGREKSNLAMLTQIRDQAAVMPIQPSGSWEKMEIIIDSGATVSVMPPSAAACYPVAQGAASRAGVCYEVANGQELPNLGEKFMAVLTSEGTVRGHLSQVADVSKPLQSVRAMMMSNHAVIFDNEGSYSLNKDTGEKNAIEDDGTNFKMIQWIIPANELENVMALVDTAGFTRQGR